MTPSDATEKIIPAEKEVAKPSVPPPSSGKEIPSSVNEPPHEVANKEEQKEEIRSKIDTIGKKKPSGLSLKSIQHKRALLAKQKEKHETFTSNANEPFTQTQIQAAWDEYSKHLKKHGNHNLASIIGAETPTLDKNKIHVEMPTETMKLELERAQGKLMGFIKKRIKNDQIELEIDVNEKAEKKYVFTARDKYEKLKEKNPLLEKLRKTFDLDV